MSKLKNSKLSPAESMSKPQKLSPVDRISNLPDSLLCHILSFLPTKQVVATSILSSRWTTLWTHVPCLYFEDSTNYSSDQDDDDDDNDKRMRFTHFVYRVLTLLKAPTVETFRLQCEEESDPFHVNTWICAAIGRGVKELDLSPGGDNSIQLPRSAFTCESLVVLKLYYPISLNYPSYIHFPSLKILYLGVWVCEDDDEDSVNKLISGCPILEDLHVRRSLRRVSTFNISIPTLKRLRVYISGASSWAKVQINTPSLDNLDIRDPYPAEYLLKKLPNLVQAYVDIIDKRNNGENYGECVLKLLRGLYNVKILSFSYLTCGINNSFDDPPLFHNLVNLSLCVDSFECNVLKTLLKNSPNLKVLGISKIGKVTYEGCESCWSQSSCIPKCLSSHLETFSVSSFDGWEHELEFVKYILKNALVLVTMTVNTWFLEELEEIDLIKKLSMFPRGSKTCQLAFHSGMGRKAKRSQILSQSQSQ